MNLVYMNVVFIIESCFGNFLIVWYESWLEPVSKLGHSGTQKSHLRFLGKTYEQIPHAKKLKARHHFFIKRCC